ncbi:MMPL family transporter [Pseudorhodoferax sp. Leaf267]|uniref:MMPL family transporter n=1 Tax=Pseudorhodoferax sp. Leaf267 TaxID=1736316 RepID=UPI000701423A|nr:MMPL family transporter [Pseudorhodoferax sp. Leaf267]KQP11846.1 transporter [Pseudorhodoferax sp. Leaf267]
MRHLRHTAIGLWLLFVLAAAAITARTHYVADLSAFLPRNPSAEQAVLLDQLQSGVAARLVLIGIEGGTPAQRTEASVQLADALRQSGAFDAVHNGDNSGFEETGKFLFANRYLLSPGVDAQRFTVDGLRDGIYDTTSLLGTPAGNLIKPILLQDPTGETVRMAENMLPAQAPRSDGRVWISRDGHRAVVLATTHADGGDLDGQERALNLVRSSFEKSQAQGLTLVVSGAGTFATASRAQIKTEVERLAIAGGVIVVGLLLLSFGGSLRTLFTALLPVTTGVLAGIAAVSLVFGNVHGITLGFGTTLIGEAVDYAIYYLIQARGVPGAAAGLGARRWLGLSWPTVRLGLWTSLCGFAALLFSGFPGLAQLGLFSIAGLTGAALTTRFVLTAISPDGAPGMGLRRHLGRAVAAAMRVLQRMRWALVALAVAAAATVAWLPSPWRGDLASLSPAGDEKMQIDARLRADLGADDPGVVVAVTGTDEASVLRAAEAAGARLDQLVAEGKLAGYASPARLLPSPAVQQARRDALPEADALRARLQEATVDGPIAAARLGPFIDDVAHARTQPLLTRASLDGTPLAAAFDALLVPGSGTRPWRGLLTLSQGTQPLDTPALRAAFADMPQVQVVDISGELRSLYSRYLHEAGVQAALGALALCAVLLLHLRSLLRLGRIALAVGSATLIVVAALSLAGVEMGILHLVGLLLTVAIGSNYALFFDQLRAEQEAHTGPEPLQPDHDLLASLALANVTAATSFFLLALSNIPTLNALGQVVAPGIALCLLLSAAFIPTRQAARSV